MNDFSYLKVLEQRLDDEQKEILKSIYEPTIVGVPLCDSRRHICVMPDGELRSYGFEGGSHDGTQIIYSSSYDCGLSWTHARKCKGKYGPYAYFAEKEIFITTTADADGTYAYISKTGSDDISPKAVKISDHAYACMFLPQMSEYSNRIWVTGQRPGKGDFSVPAFIYTDDFGESWHVVELPICPVHELVYPHKDMRWYIHSGSEPHVAEISKEKMMMILRTSTDYFYESFSYDGGETWSEMQPSPFYGTNTTAYLLKMSDGRCVTFWNNTKPLPELRHDKQMPPLPESIVTGYWEDVFTNRDASHIAVSDDGGESWKGFRELYLNPIRNASDFRYHGKKFTSNDKSVHQFQALELPYGKVLVSVGQNVTCYKLMIFDVNWLYETERKETFINGLSNVSTQVYLKSIPGSTSIYGNGHCAWNRTNGAVMMPDPDGGYLETVLISKHHDERLFNDVQGVVWNFPASKKGEVTADIKLMEKRVRISLADRWYNPCDENLLILANFSFELDLDDIDSKFTKINIKYDTEKGMAEVFADERFLFKVKMTGEVPVGISYIIVQCATDGDSKGVYLRLLEKK